MPRCTETDDTGEQCDTELQTREFEFDPEPSTDTPTPSELRREFMLGEREIPDDVDTVEGKYGEYPAYLDGESAPDEIEPAGPVGIEHHCPTHGIVSQD